MTGGEWFESYTAASSNGLTSLALLLTMVSGYMVVASATETVREALKSTDCKLIEGMEVAGIMNAQIRFHLPGNVSFENCKIVPISQMKQKEGALE